ncbi:hypothetical protein [Arsenicicoccus dermatophilus]|uniref:hypothetical protein n=1 Tax=Arsenicicoccus dermatophilus TaxID=1076331 RepID=UPI001F4D114E|nr:hypothetical protein [Arsenicicoccus dermatophilus]MCH8611782.1 hypothetical protein [Arsenicicoccus dermatophilus]
MSTTHSTIHLAQTAAIAATALAGIAWVALARVARCAPAAEVWHAGYQAGRNHNEETTR